MTSTEAIVAVQGFDDMDPPRKLVRIVARPDGSYSVSVPYHPARSGLLVKQRLPTIADFDGMELKPDLKYRVDTPVKLSLRASGFVQFSSVGKLPIRSGATRFHVPKGIGVQSRSILEPIETGTSWAVAFHQRSQCEPVDGTERVPVYVFAPGEFFEPGEHQTGRHIFSVEGTVFAASRRKEAFLGRKGWVIRAPYGHERPEWEVDFRVFDLPNSLAFLGLMVRIYHSETPFRSGGYVVSAPRDRFTNSAMFGLFPLPEDSEIGRDAQSLTYLPDVDRDSASGGADRSPSPGGR